MKGVEYIGSDPACGGKTCEESFFVSLRASLGKISDFSVAYKDKEFLAYERY